MKNEIRYIISVFFLWGFLGSSQTFATPPRNIQLEYDFAKQQLHITMEHVTKNPRKHRIRRISVTVNNGPAKDFFYSSQTSGKGMDVIIPLKAKAGDVIHVKAVCSEAGSGTKEITVTEPLTDTNEDR